MVELAEEFVVEDLETLKVVAHPLRLQILSRLKQPKTVKEIAAILEIPPTKLYYHVNQLEERGLIQVVDMQIVSGIIEKQYQAVARRYRIDESMLADSETSDERVDTLLTSFFDVARAEIKQSVRAGLSDLKNHSEPHKGSLLRVHLHLFEDQAIEFYRRLEALIEEYQALTRENEEKAEAQLYGLMLSFFPFYRPQDEENHVA